MNVYLFPYAFIIASGNLEESFAFAVFTCFLYTDVHSSEQEEEIDGVDFIIIASDGLWNVLSNEVIIHSNYFVSHCIILLERVLIHLFSFLNKDLFWFWF